ncbi:hypothetical protein AMATHDRAFT_75424 [Amanita thiersii Skay4041]|uniref:C3H1-type domain-containing protein n=1 Tax=Amanita thiersii Skay4041 TaxID=703135 RepID=A0A2A9NSJ0_9AGAR|nr:hypothetical protein AMATHDRAFT_75424 [Amanita thiersii Skay4041]
MIFDPATTPQLKPWLVRTLEPICDAEPGALADYILALLKHNVPETEMRKELASQLDEFLEKECAGFIDTLFTVLRTKSYLPYAANPPSPPPIEPKPLDTGIPIPLDGLISPATPSEPRSRKRSIETDDRDSRPPPKGPRLDSDSQFSRYGTGAGRQDGRQWAGRDDRSQGGYRDGGLDMFRGGMNGGIGHMNGRRPQSYQPPDQKRGICRDYHNNGYCARGALCKYSHGDDAVIPGPMFPPMAPGLPFLPMFTNGGFGPAVAYDPHEAQMDMRPLPGGRTSHQRAPLLPRVQQPDGSRVLHPVNASGELPVIQDLTPNIPRDPQQKSQPVTSSESQQTQSQQNTGPTSQQPHPEMFNPAAAFNLQLAAAAAMNGFPHMGLPMDIDMTGAAMNMGIGNHGGGFNGQGGQSGGGGSRGRGGFSNDAHKFRPERRNGTTLVVEKIPEDRLTLEQVNDWFKRFGTVTNVAIDAMGAKALVSFSKHEEAHAAWKSEDAVFGNRFVKVFWHRPMEGHGKVGARLLAASAPLMASMAAKDTTPPPAGAANSTSNTTPTPTSQTTPRKPVPAASSSAAAALAAKQKLLEEQIAEQKSLMASLDTASPEEKKSIMARLRKLGEEMTKPSAEPPTTTAHATGSAVAAPSPTSSTPASGAVKRSTSTPVDDRERIMREKLDKELEMHHASITTEGGGETTEELKAKLEKLRAEAASLGISETTTNPEPWQGGGYRGGYRGRGRGVRGFYRGAMRGGPPRGSMKLDNRPKRLLVKGAKEENIPALQEWYNATGQVESVHAIDTGDVVVSFRTRPAAEQALSNGAKIPNIGPVQVTWYTGTAASTSSTGASTSQMTATSSSHPNAGEAMVEDVHRSRSPPHEEEVVASGWGGGDDDGDGMGMY